MLAHILILQLIVFGTHPSGHGIAMQEFASKERCENAVTLFVKEVGRSGKFVRHVCVRK